MEIRKLNCPPQAEAVRDMVRYARNVIEEFRRAKHYKYNLSVCLTGRVWWEAEKRERRRGVESHFERKTVSCECVWEERWPTAGCRLCRQGLSSLDCSGQECHMGKGSLLEQSRC